MSGRLLKLDEIPAFAAVKDAPLHEVNDAVRAAVRSLHEIDEMEEFIRAILSDRAATPHGPAELVDILTHRIEVDGRTGWAAFILKGRSFPRVRHADVAHQIYRLEKIEGLNLAVFAASGVVLDAAKEQFSSTCLRMSVDHCFLDADDLGRLFWAYGFLCPRDGNRVVGGRCSCGYAPSHAPLNVLQFEALAELKRAHALRQARGLVVLPPGTGKTRIAAQDAKRAGAKTILYIAHTYEILDVAESEFAALFGADHVSINEVRNEGVTLATIQHLARNLDEWTGRAVDYVVIDEFHHAAAPTYRAAVRRLNFGFLLGLTATPFRADRQDIAELCDGNIVVSYELRSGIETGILSPYHYYGCFDDVDYESLDLRGGKYTVKDLERKLIIKERHEAVVRKWREKAENKPTIAFCCGHTHAERVAEEFNEQGIVASVYLSDTPRTERQALIDGLESGAIKVLCVVDVLNEGADIRSVECLLFLRPTESKRIFLQQLGRGLRRHVGKSHCVVIDFIGNFRNAYKVVEYHGLRPEEAESASSPSHGRTIREVLDLPLGCKVDFDDRVLELFASQTLDPRAATRQNISRILFYEYEKLERRLGRRPTEREVDRNLLLGARFYRMVFGSWKRFEEALPPEETAA